MLFNSDTADILFKRLFILLFLLIVAMIIIRFNYSTSTAYFPAPNAEQNLFEINRGDIAFTSMDI